MAEDEGGFENARENLDGHPIRSLLAYARPYWLRLAAGVFTSFCPRFARLVPPIVVATAIDRVVLGSGEPGLLAEAGLVPAGAIAGEAARVAVL